MLSQYSLKLLEKDNFGYYTLSMVPIDFAMINAVKELDDKNEKLESENKN